MRTLFEHCCNRVIETIRRWHPKMQAWRLAPVVLLALFAGLAQAATINVLWYTGGVGISGSSFFPGGLAGYKSAVNTLAAAAPGAPGGNTWVITFWDSGSKPAGAFNVLVVASPQGGWSPSPSYAALMAAAPALGDRIMLTGQDADWHYMNGPGPAVFDNPKGFLLDGINWAGSGSGLGAVLLGANSSSLLASLGITGFGSIGGGSDSVVIPAPVASFPINTGLTSAGLSGWGTSAHSSFTGFTTSLWTGINVVGGSLTSFVTIVSASTAGGGIGAGGGCPDHTVHGHIVTTAPDGHDGDSHAHHAQHGHSLIPGTVCLAAGHHVTVNGHILGLTPESTDAAIPSLTREPDFVAALNQNGLNAPAAPGTVVQLFGSARGLFLDLADLRPALGFTAPASGSPLYYTESLPEVQVGGVKAEVLFSGLAPGLKGVWQINVRIPDGVQSGKVPVTIAYEGDAATSIDLAVE